MPMVGGKKYPYTKEGKEAAAKARKGYAKGGKSVVLLKAKPC